MCGIAGYLLNTGSAGEAVLRAMCAQIQHRGPDDEGVYVDGGCGIAMRRLSIIDLSTGHQPIPNEDSSVWVVFNGEIYNYKSLREDLIGHGHQFRTDSDTETLVHLYEQYGLDAFTKLRGMYAFALWDAREQMLVLVRDRFGKKPLYYSVSPDGLWFGSELKCLRAAGVPLQDLDEEALRQYFQFAYIPDPRTPYKNVKKLPAGSWLTYRKGGSIREGRYWKVPVPAETPPPGVSEAEMYSRIRDLFDESVRMRMVADVPLGAFLSGGIDSSSVVASMALASREPVKTFSIGFEESEFNELPYAAEVAKFYKTDHHEILVRPDSIGLVQKLVHHFDEPFGDSSAIPTYLVSEFAAQHVKVVLTGDGGDELFAGYESFFHINRLRVFDHVPQMVRSLGSGIANLLPYSAYGKNYLRMASRPSALERYFELNYMPYFLRKQLLKDHWMLPSDAASIRSMFSDCLIPNGADIVSQALRFEATAKLTGDMLVKVDRMSMAASIEVRCPMLDHKLAELAFQIPNEWKMRNGQGKHIFIKAVGERLPAGLLNRPKKGFGVPLELWFRTSLRSFLWDHLTSKDFLGRGMVSENFVRHLLSEHDSGRRNNYHWLWSLLMLELWFRHSDQDLASSVAAKS